MIYYLSKKKLKNIILKTKVSLNVTADLAEKIADFGLEWA